MTDVARRYLLLGCALILLVALVVLVMLRHRVGGAGSGSGISLAESVTISGQGDKPIRPGTKATIELEFTNQRSIPLSVRDVSVTVREVKAPRADAALPCTIDDFTVEQLPVGTNFRLPGHASRTLSDLGVPRATWPRVGLAMRPVNQDGCKDATLVLAYHASGSPGW